MMSYESYMPEKVPQKVSQVRLSHDKKGPQRVNLSIKSMLSLKSSRKLNNQGLQTTKASYHNEFHGNKKLKQNFSLCSGNKSYDLKKFITKFDELQSSPTKTHIDSVADITK